MAQPSASCALPRYRHTDRGGGCTGWISEMLAHFTQPPKLSWRSRTAGEILSELVVLLGLQLLFVAGRCKMEPWDG